MNKIIIIINTVLIATFLSACSEKTQTVEWYMEHKDKLAEELKKCKLKLKTFEELTRDKHCQVIDQAQRKVFLEHEKNAPLSNIQFK